MSDNVAYTASGVLTLHVPIPSARTEAGQAAEPAAIGLWSIYTTNTHPNTGNLVEGFKWDGRYWYSDSDENNSQTLPTNWDATFSGVTTTYFQSGMGSGQDLEFDHVDFLPSSGLFSQVFRPWTPVVHHGYYYDYDEESYLYSDDSEVVYPGYSNLVPGIHGSYNKVQLTSIPKVGVPISAERYYWNNDEGKYEIDLRVRRVVEFTGTRDADYVRASTWSDQIGTIVWENIDHSSPEFVVVDSGLVPTVPYAIFNQQLCQMYPTVSGTWEEAGFSTGGANQQFHLKYAPIDSTAPLLIHSYSTVSGIHTTWSAIPTSGNFTTLSHGVKVDYDLGLLEFGDPAVSGVNVPIAGHIVAASYYPSVRVEYEPEYLTDLATGLEANLNPVYRTSGRGFVYLSTRADDAVSITLSANAPKIQTNLFGPVNIGNSFVPVVATVTDARGLPVEGANVDISITSVPTAGRFGSLGDTATATTNHLGEGKAYYNPPLNINEIGELVTASGYSRTPDKHSTILHINNLLLSGSLKDLFIYQVWTDDPTQGYLNSRVDHTSETLQKEAYFLQYFNDEKIYGPTGLSTLTTLSTGAETWEETHRDIWNLTQLSLFSTSTMDVKKVLCATYDGNAYNPHTFKAGAIAPFQASGVLNSSGGGYDLYFDTTHYEMPVPSGSYGVGASGIIYGYFIVAPTTVSMRASTYNSRLNQTFYSNEIQLKVQIPSYLNGMWYVDALNQSNYIAEISPMLASGIVIGSGIPLGFRLRSSSITLAGALNGVTFLDVNPEASSEAAWAASGIIASGGYY